MSEDHARVAALLVKTLRQEINSISSIAGGYAEPYLAQIAEKLMHDLFVAGYKIDVLPKGHKTS